MNSIEQLLKMNDHRRIWFYHYVTEVNLAVIRTIQDENDWAMFEIVWPHSENDWAYNKNGWPLFEFVWPHDENEWPKFKIGWSIDENECLLTKLKWHMLVPLLWRRNWSLPLMNLKRKPANMNLKTYTTTTKKESKVLSLRSGQIMMTLFISSSCHSIIRLFSLIKMHRLFCLINVHT